MELLKRGLSCFVEALENVGLDVTQAYQVKEFDFREQLVAVLLARQ